MKSNEDQSISSLGFYQEREEIPLSALHIVSKEQHTLLDALPDYVRMKTDHLATALHNAMEQEREVLVVGVLSEHLEDWCATQGWKITRRVDVRTRRRQDQSVALYDGRAMKKFSNTARPELAWVESNESGAMLLIVVVPGRDYVVHTAELVFARMTLIKEEHYLTYSLDDKLHIIIFKDACEGIMDMMGLDKLKGVIAGSYVVLGYSEFFCSYIQQVPELAWKVVDDGALFDPPAGCFFAHRLLERKDGTRALFLSMRHTFWGDISFYLVKKLIALGSKGIIYGAKLGTLLSDEKVESSLFMPQNFACIDPVTGACQEVIGVRNCISGLPGSELKLGGHISVPTIYCESKQNVDRLLNGTDFSSIDNEIGQMARAIAGSKDVSFGVVHYATDFLHVWANNIQVRKNMLNTDPAKAQHLKARQAERIALFLVQSTSAPIRVSEPKNILPRIKAVLREKYSRLSLDLLVSEDHERDKRLCDLSCFLEPRIRLGGAALDRQVVEKHQPSHSVVEQQYLAEPLPLSSLWARGASSVVMFGTGGSGKSSLCKFIAYKSTDSQDPLWSNRFDVILAIELSNFRRVAQVTLREVITSVFCHSMLQDDCDVVLKWFKEHADRYVMMFDGLDEVWESSHFIGLKSFLSSALQAQVTGLNHILVATRPSLSLPLWGSDSWLKCDILGFTAAQVYQFVERFFGATAAQAKVTKDILTRRPEIFQACLLPWHACLFCETISRRRVDEPFSLADLYRDMIDRLRGTYDRRLTQFHGPSDGVEWSDVRQKLSQLAFESLKLRSLLIPRRDWALVARPLVIALPNSGLLRPIGEGEYYFVHYTILEYLAAEYVAVIAHPRFDTKMCSLRLDPAQGMFLRFLARLVVEKAKAPSILRTALISCESVLPNAAGVLLIVPAGWSFGLDIVLEIAARWNLSVRSWIKDRVPSIMFSLLAKHIVDHLWLVEHVKGVISGEILLQAACDGGKAVVITQLLQDVSASRISLLQLAASGDGSLTRRVITAGADPVLAVAGAAGGGHEKLCVALLEKIPAESRKDVPLGIAVRNGFSLIVKELLKRGADCNQVITLDHEYPLSLIAHYAIMGDKPMVQYLLECKASIHDAVSGAASFHDTALVQFLISREGVDPCKLDVNLGVIRPCAQHATILLKTGAQPREKHGWTPLMIAALKGDAPTLEILLESCLDLLNHRGSAPWGPPEPNHVLTLSPFGNITIRPARASSGWTALHIASVMGNVDAVRCLLHRRARLDICNDDGWTPLNSATFFARMEVVRLLISRDLVNVATKGGASPLHCAVLGGLDAAIPLLVEHGARVSSKLPNGETALYLAASSGRLNALCLLHKAGGDLQFPRNDGIPPLYTACEFGHLSVIQYLLDNGVDLEFAGLPYAGLQLAAKCGHLGVVDLLIQRSVDVNFGANLSTGTALFFASANGHEIVVQQLLCAGAKPNTKPSPMAAACANGHVQVVEVLCNAGCRDFGDNIPPICVACENNRWDVVQLLLVKGASANAHGTSGWTPLMYIAGRGDLDLLNLVFDFGDSPLGVDSLNEKRDTALFIACEQGHLEVVDRLLEKRASPAAGQRSPLLVACQKDHTSIVRSLIAAKAKVNVDCGKWTPLTWCCAHGKAELVQLLIDAGALPLAMNRSGKNARHYAKGKGTIIAILLQSK